MIKVTICTENEDYMNRKVDYSKLKYLILDVDGTLTDSGVIYDDLGNELKRFSTKDGSGFNIAHEAGFEIIVMTGRECKATLRRMEELKTEYIFQNVKKKPDCLKQFMEEKNASAENFAYIGDDLNDYKTMMMCGFVGCPLESAPEIKDISDYVSPVRAGYGAMRDIVEEILRRRGDRDAVIKRVIEKMP